MIETLAPLCLSDIPGKKSGSKNIVICCDGTGNEFGNFNSNVVKLYTALKIDNAQVGYYHPGVGTMGDPAARNYVDRLSSQIRGLAFGAGFKDNVFDAYRYLMEVYNDGDRVFLFGFSRGAYTARALAGLLDGYGLLCRGNEGHIPYAWRSYTKQLKKRDRHSLDKNYSSAGAFKETFSHENFCLHFVGLWDTVSSVGWIATPLRLYNVAQNRSIRCGRHAISIDERRCKFQSNLWGDSLPGQDILQVWFAGVHSDIGGSYAQDDSVLSDITLQWMVEELQKKGDILFKPERLAMIFGTPATDYPDTSPLYKSPRNSLLHNSLDWRWWALEVIPGLHFSTDSEKEVYRIPLSSPRDIPVGSFIHSSVVRRMQNKVANYKPINILAGSLSPSPLSTSEDMPLLFTFDRDLAPESNFKRRSLLFLVCLLDVLFIRLVWLLLVVISRFIKSLAVLFWPCICCFAMTAIHLIESWYASFSHFVTVHLGPAIAYFFFLHNS